LISFSGLTLTGALHFTKWTKLNILACRLLRMSLNAMDFSVALTARDLTVHSTSAALSSTTPAVTSVATHIEQTMTKSNVWSLEEISDRSVALEKLATDVKRFVVTGASGKLLILNKCTNKNILKLWNQPPTHYDTNQRSEIVKTGLSCVFAPCFDTSLFAQTIQGEFSGTTTQNIAETNYSLSLFAFQSYSKRITSVGKNGYKNFSF